MVKKFDYVILGAGIAGLSFAWKMSKAGKSVLVLEKDNVLGGLSRTIEHDGFLLDYCAHRFHSNNPEVLSTVCNFPGLIMKKHIKKTRIFMFQKYLKYPFELPNLLRAMPVYKAGQAGFDFILNTIRQKYFPTQGLSYKDWFTRIYGNELYKVMCEPYTTKIWKMDPSQISADWAEARFGGPNLVALIKKSIKKFITLDFSDFNLEDDSLAPDGGVFYYPDEGIGALPEAFAKEAKKAGTHIELNVTPTSINRRDKKITYLKSGKTKIVSYKTLVSTIPLFSLYQLIGEKKHIVEQEFSKTKYMDIIFVYVFLKKDRVSADHWLYFPDPEIPFNRAVEFGNWSKRMVPEGKTSVCLDITCYYGDQIWNSSDKELSESCIQSADNIGYFKKEDVIDTYVHRVRYAYPVYDRDYKKRLETIVSFLEKKDLYLLGRTGIFRYNNSDNSIEMAFQLAKNLLTNSKKKSLFNYEIKNASL